MTREVRVVRFCLLGLLGVLVLLGLYGLFALLGFLEILGFGIPQLHLNVPYPNTSITYAINANNSIGKSINQLHNPSKSYYCNNPNTLNTLNTVNTCIIRSNYRPWVRNPDTFDNTYFRDLRHKTW